MASDPDIVRVSNAAACLAEHFDTVQIIATKFEGGSTSLTHSTRGNWYAAKGSVREWLERSDEETRESMRSKD